MTWLQLAVEWLGPWPGRIAYAVTLLAVGFLFGRASREKTPEEMKKALSEVKIERNDLQRRVMQLTLGNDALRERLAWYRGHARALAEGPNDGRSPEVARALEARRVKGRSA